MIFRPTSPRYIECTVRRFKNNPTECAEMVKFKINRRLVRRTKAGSRGKNEKQDNTQNEIGCKPVELEEDQVRDIVLSDITGIETDMMEKDMQRDT